MTFADFESEACDGAVEHVSESLLQNRAYLADRRADYQDRWLCLGGIRANGFERNLDRLRMFAIEVAQDVVDSRHENRVPLLHYARRERHVRVEPHLGI